MTIREIYLNPERPTDDLFDRTGEGEMRVRRTAVAGSPNNQGAG